MKNIILKLREMLFRARAWMVSFAHKPQSMFFLFLFAFADASFFPTADIVLFAILISAPRRGFKAAFYSTLGSVSGGILGYYIGYGLMELVGWKIIDFYNAYDFWQTVVDAYRGPFGDWFIAIASFTPIPFKIATISAGAVKMSLINFIIISLIGRAARYYLFGAVMYFGGPKLKPLIDKYFFVFSIIMIIVIILGFVSVEVLF